VRLLVLRARRRTPLPVSPKTTMDDLFQHHRPDVDAIADGLVLLSGFADTAALLAELDGIVADAPFRHMQTPGGKPISVAVTNCGELGWVSDRRGYRYQPTDPVSGDAWPAMPDAWRALAVAAAARAGFAGYRPNACLINRYAPGTRLTSHQDKNERDFSQPVVTVSTGLPAEFQVFGETRGGRPRAVPVYHGDVLVMGGAARLWFHGVRELRASPGDDRKYRISLTFRDA
jgi:alkylated DNA repair protein (DNA oxidative demethylase)